MGSSRPDQGISQDSKQTIPNEQREDKKGSRGDKENSPKSQLTMGMPRDFTHTILQTFETIRGGVVVCFYT